VNDLLQLISRYSHWINFHAWARREKRKRQTMRKFLPSKYVWFTRL